MALWRCWRKWKQRAERAQRERGEDILAARTYPLDGEVEYQPTMERLEKYLTLRKASRRERMEFYRFAIRAICMDIQTTSLSKIIYREVSGGWLIDAIFPAASTALRAGLARETDVVRLKGKTVFSVPYSLEKMGAAVKDLSLDGGFRAEKNSTNGIYIPELRLAMVANGIHHATAAHAIDGSAVMEAEVYRLEKLFPLLKVSEDGSAWVGDGWSEKILDARFALIYELARKVQEIECAGLG